MRWAVGRVGALGVLAMGLVGCVGQAFTMEVGDCFRDDDLETETATQVTDVPLVDCDDPHDNEVFALVDLPDGDYPADVADLALDSCEGEKFSEYVGAPSGEAGFSVLAFWPTEQSWSQGDREVICYLYRDDLAPMTGSQQATARPADFS